MTSKNKKNEISKRDRYVLYQESVQDVVAEIDFVDETFGELKRRRALTLREDFCGTANTACEWVRRAGDHRALGVDRDGAVLEWGRTHNLARLRPAARRRIRLREADVREVKGPRTDIVLAMNFSYYLFLTRAEMVQYFRAVHSSLVGDGVFFLDAYGGYDSPREIVETRECEGFSYVWEQASFNPINSHMQCYIHFEFPDGTRMDRAFSYYWRLWTLPELRELLEEAGFKRTRVYWEGTDPETNEGDGMFTETEVGDPDPGWICYLVAER